MRRDVWRNAIESPFAGPVAPRPEDQNRAAHGNITVTRVRKRHGQWEKQLVNRNFTHSEYGPPLAIAPPEGEALWARAQRFSRQT